MAAGNNNRIALVFLVGAFIVASGAIYGIFSILNGYKRLQRDVADQAIPTVTIVTASRTLYQGVGITPDDLFVMNIPPDYLPMVKDEASGDAVRVDTFQSRERVVGQVPRERILANEFIRPERLADGSAGLGLNALIPRGMRAISVGLKGADAVSGFLTPGSYVDVLVTMNDEFNQRRTETILQAVFVLGVNSRGQNDTRGEVGGRGAAPSVTFLVTPRQAEDIAYADEIGEISLTLRNVQDVNYNNLPGATLDTLLARLKPKPEPVEPIRVFRPRQPAPERGPVIQIWRGTSSTTVEAK